MLKSVRNRLKRLKSHIIRQKYIIFKDAHCTLYRGVSRAPHSTTFFFNWTLYPWFCYVTQLRHINKFNMTKIFIFSLQIIFLPYKSANFHADKSVFLEKKHLKTYFLRSGNSPDDVFLDPKKQFKSPIPNKSVVISRKYKYLGRKYFCRLKNITSNLFLNCHATH
jgi:hypothetical protein